jgi:hypothetical protein
MIKKVTEFWINMSPAEYPVAIVDEDGDTWSLAIATYEEDRPPYHGELRVIKDEQA